MINPCTIARSAAVAAILALTPTAQAAEITFKKTECEIAKAGSGCGLIFIIGDIVLGDEKQFIKVLSDNKVVEAAVVMHSAGGSVPAGLAIGRKIHEMEFTTAVPKDWACMSICAAMWLAGSRRFANTHSAIGFHQVFFQDAHGRKSFSSTGNALIGAYYAQLGLSDDAIVYLTTAMPDGITWLKFGKARQLGINVEAVDDTGRPVAEQKVAKPLPYITMPPTVTAPMLSPSMN